jgi:hypothetical protein
MGKLPPSALLRQQLEQQVDGVNRGQQRQQVDTPQLCGAEMSRTTARGGVRPSLAEKPIGNERGELLKQGVGAGGRKQRIHAANPTLKKRLRPHGSGSTLFLTQPVTSPYFMKTFVTPSTIVIFQ